MNWVPRKLTDVSGSYWPQGPSDSKFKFFGPTEGFRPRADGLDSQLTGCSIDSPPQAIAVPGSFVLFIVGQRLTDRHWNALIILCI